jgi:nucleoside-triphosphatase THEP1
MKKTITPNITITIERTPGSGKTTLLNLIGKNLLNQGMNVQCIERFQNGPDQESYNVQPTNMIYRKRDDRLIQIVALEKTSKPEKKLGSYTEITQTIRDEIQRLAEKSRKKPLDENGEIYREWAYGAFLAWQLIVGDNAKAGDAKLLESIATGEQPF